MKKHCRLFLVPALLFFSQTAEGQNIFSFSGSGNSNGLTYHFYSPAVTGNKTFPGIIVNSGHVQLLTDTSAVLDTSILHYDLDSIPPQIVFYNTPCKFYIKSDSLNRIHKAVKESKFYITQGSPRGIFSIDRLNLVSYNTSLDTLDFEVKFALITASNDTVKSKTSVHFNIVPAMPFETSTFGVGGQHLMPDPEDREWRIQTIDSNTYTTDGFNLLNNQHLRTISYSGVKIVLEKNSISNQLYLLDKSTNLDTLNLYAETIVVRDGFTFHGTTINIFAKELIFEDVGERKAYLSTKPFTPPIPLGTPRQGQRGGDVYLHLLKFSSNPAPRFFLQGGDGDTAIVTGGPIAPGGDGGDMYSNLDLRDYVVHDGGYSGKKSWQNGIPYKGNPGKDLISDREAEWLNPKFFSLVVNYYKEGWYAGLTEPISSRLLEYSDMINKYADNGSIYQLEPAIQLQLRQISDEINRVFYALTNNLDYYGNPPGWVPMLSFEVALSVYTNEISHALNILFLDHLIQNANNNLFKRVQGFVQLRDETMTFVNDNKETYREISLETIPNIKDEIENNKSRIGQLNQELERLKKEIEEREKKRAKKSQTWKWIGAAVSLAAIIPSPIQPFAAGLSIAGEGILKLSEQNFAKKILSTNVIEGLSEANGIIKKVDAVIQPWINTDISGKAGSIFTNASDGVSKIYDEIRNNMHNREDAERIFKMGEELYDKNYETYKDVRTKMNSTVDVFNDIKLSGADLEKVAGDLYANDPRVGFIQNEIKALHQNSIKLDEQLQVAMQEMQQSKNNVYEGLTAIGNFNFAQFSASSAMDHKLSVLSGDMRRKAFERLRKYHYYLMKAYEYRTLQAYPYSLNTTNIILRIDSLVNAGKTTLTAFDRDLLAAVYKEEIQQIAEDLYTYYQQNRPSQTLVRNYTLSLDDIKTLNQKPSKPVILNFVEAGLFPPKEEDLRIIDITVTKVKLSTENGTHNGNFNSIDFQFDYPNYSRIKKKGQVYNFNNYTLHTEYPIYWKDSYDLLTGKIEHSRPSPSANSLLWWLINGAGPPPNPDEFGYYSRPAAWADIILTKVQTTNGTALAKIDSIYVEIKYEYLHRPENMINVEMNTTNKWFAPTFNISKIDKFNRQSGIKNVHRAYTSSAFTFITAEAPKNYGVYTFEKWVDRYGNDLDVSNGIDTSGHNKIRFSLNDDRSFKAKYKFTGAILDIPDTVYLGDSLKYNLKIKNTGSGSLFWEFDSSANWIKYFVNSGVNDASVALHFDPNTDLTKTRIGVLDVTSTETELFHNYIYFVQNKGTVKANEPPVVNITSPVNDTVYNPPAVILLKADAKDADGISSVEFYNQGKLLHTDSTAPYNYTLKNAAPGDYFFVARATDKKGLYSLSSNVQVTVQPGVSLEAEEAVLKGAVVASDKAGFTGSGFADYVNASGDFIEWTVNISTSDAGLYSLNFRYANGTTSDRPLKLEVNGVVISAVMSFTSTGGWATWSVSSATANLIAGTNKIRLTTIGSNGPNLDHLRIQSQTLEAEEAVLHKAVIASNQPGFTGTGFADYQNASGDFIEWTVNVKASDAGVYLLKFRYANGAAANRPLMLEVNGALKNTGLAFSSTGGWATWSVSSATTSLIAGINKVRLTTTGSNGPNVDHLKLQSTSAGAEKVVLAGAPSGSGKIAINDVIGLKLIPNPANKILNIYTTGLQKNKQLTVSVISASGAIIKTKQSTGSTQVVQLDVSSLISGVYTVKVISSDRVMYERFVKL